MAMNDEERASLNHVYNLWQREGREAARFRGVLRDIARGLHDPVKYAVEELALEKKRRAKHRKAAKP